MKLKRLKHTSLADWEAGKGDEEEEEEKKEKVEKDEKAEKVFLKSKQHRTKHRRRGEKNLNHSFLMNSTLTNFGGLLPNTERKA